RGRAGHAAVLRVTGGGRVTRAESRPPRRAVALARHSARGSPAGRDLRHGRGEAREGLTVTDLSPRHQKRHADLVSTPSNETRAPLSWDVTMSRISCRA